MPPDGSEDFVPKTYSADVGQSAAAVMGEFLLACIMACLLILAYIEWTYGRILAAIVAGACSFCFLCLIIWTSIGFLKAIRQKLTLNKDSFTTTRGADSKTFSCSNILAITCSKRFGTRFIIRSLDGAEIIDMNYYRLEEQPAIYTYFYTRYESYLNANCDYLPGMPDTRGLWKAIAVCWLMALSFGMILWDHEIQKLHLIKHVLSIWSVSLFEVIRQFKISRSSRIPTNRYGSREVGK